MITNQHRFPDTGVLTKAVHDRIVAGLTGAIEERGNATLVLSGGSTPVRVYGLLADAKLDWGRVTVTLADERWVEPGDERSNAGLLARSLFAGSARAARFIPLYHGTSPEEDARAASAALADLPLPFDIVLLGMGEDGHTASLFPGGDRLMDALADDGPDLVLPISAPGAAEPRLTLTLRALADARNLLLMFIGDKKSAVFDRARMSGTAADLPVRAFLHHAEATMDVYST